MELCFPGAGSYIPGLVDLLCVSSAGEVFDVSPCRAVDQFPVGSAQIQEVRPKPADRILGDVCQRLAHGGTENEGADGFVKAGNVAAERRLGLDAV